MIKIDLILAVMLIVFFPLVLVFVREVFYNYSWKGKIKDEVLEQCPFCTHLFYSLFKEDLIWVCPKCKSLVQRTLVHNERKVKRG